MDPSFYRKRNFKYVSPLIWASVLHNSVVQTTLWCIRHCRPPESGWESHHLQHSAHAPVRCVDNNRENVVVCHMNTWSAKMSSTVHAINPRLLHTHKHHVKHGWDYCEGASHAGPSPSSTSIDASRGLAWEAKRSRNPVKLSSSYLLDHLFSVWSKTTNALETVFHSQWRTEQKRVWKTVEEDFGEAMHSFRNLATYI